jgi:Predicted protease
VGWSGSGGGWSTNSASFNAKASWQTVTYPGVTDGHRWCPDVALHSDGGGKGGYFFYYRGLLYTGSGTSFASPLFAGSLGLAEQKLLSKGRLTGSGRLGRFQDWLYSHSSGLFFDVTSGSNGTLPDGHASNAIGGWDFVTGLGAMDFNAFVNAY